LKKISTLKKGGILCVMNSNLANHLYREFDLLIYL
jgi:hypothetical protein